GRIAGILPRPAEGRVKPREDTRLVDLFGKRLLPGFIDIHTHGAAGVDFNHATAGEVRGVTRFFSSCGVTSYLPTVLSDSEETMAAQLATITDPPLLADCPEILGIHLEGPFLCASHKGAQPERFLRECDPAVFDKLQEAANGKIRLMTLAPELAGAESLTRHAVAHGTRVSLGHSAASYEQAMAAIDAGATSATHIINAMKLLHMHDPAILTAALESDIYAEMICDGFHLHPPIVRFLLKVKGRERMIAVTDSIMAAGLPDGDYVLGVHDITVKGGDAKLSRSGVRAGSTLTMIAALRNIMSFTGLDLERSSRLLSENPARMLGIFDSTGSITVGKRADLVVLDQDMRVGMTIARGAITYAAG
ncbi:MAG: N-acetylglucosamine-6-phosphate deacetylase, partial [Spirochaetota bacterium]